MFCYWGSSSLLRRAGVEPFYVSESCSTIHQTQTCQDQRGLRASGVVLVCLLVSCRAADDDCRYCCLLLLQHNVQAWVLWMTGKPMQEAQVAAVWPSVATAHEQDITARREQLYTYLPGGDELHSMIVALPTDKCSRQYKQHRDVQKYMLCAWL